MANPMFIGRLIYRPYTGIESPYRGADPGIELMEDFSFIDTKGSIWTAHQHDIVDGASIPTVLRPFVSFPYSGGKYQGWYFPASVLHDVYARDRQRPKDDTDRMFREAMIANGTLRIKAWSMWAAVWLFGPQW